MNHDEVGCKAVDSVDKAWKEWLRTMEHHV